MHVLRHFNYLLSCLSFVSHCHVRTKIAQNQCLNITFTNLELHVLLLTFTYTFITLHNHALS